MSTTTITTLELFSAPPPTNNFLDPEERSRRLRSTRKLGAMLGATPFLLESDTDLDRTPSPKAKRREGRIFSHSPSSSVSSIDTAEPDYVFVESSGKSAPYQVQCLPSPSPSRRPSIDATRNLKRKGADGVLPPIALVFEIPGSQVRSGSAAGNKGPTQPLLLRLRPVLARSRTCGSIKTSGNLGDAATTPTPPQPLSPTNSTFNMDVTSSPDAQRALSDRERRRKMAKLTRTLGENIPPELVFRAPPRRSTSVAVRSPRAEHLASFQKPAKLVPMNASGAPALAVAEAPPLPSLPPVVSNTNTEQRPKKAGSLMRRPRSLTLGTSAAAILTRGTASMDAPPTPSRQQPQPTVAEQQPFALADAVAAPSDKQDLEFGRRKEREWSGEWNLKNMDDVARRLRGLKGR